MKKTFIKLRRGILEPKHVHTLGIRFAYYVYLLDRANWNTGKVPFYTDREAADDLGINMRTIAEWRRKLDSDNYINCFQVSNYQEITINKWKNPREKEVNPIIKDDEGYKNMEDKGYKNMEGLDRGYIRGDIKHVTLPYSKELTNHTKDKNALSQEEDKHFIQSLKAIAVDCFNDNQYREINSLPKIKDGNKVMIISDDESMRKELNHRFDLFRDFILPKKIGVIEFYDDIRVIGKVGA